MELAPPSARARQGYEALYDTMRGGGGRRRASSFTPYRSGLPAAKLAAVWRLVGLARPADAPDDERGRPGCGRDTRRVLPPRSAALPATLEWAWREWLAE